MLSKTGSDPEKSTSGARRERTSPAFRELRGRGCGLLAALLLTACVDWVPLTAEGQGVRVAKAADVASCAKLGAITARTKVTVGPMARDEAKIAGELEALARNDAGTMGGNTVVATGPVDWDQRSYDVYRCE